MKTEDPSMRETQTKKLFGYLRALTDGMDLPQQRRDHPEWLLRNMRIRNATHPYLHRTTEICKELVRRNALRPPR
jgi:hypothetical protein